MTSYQTVREKGRAEFSFALQIGLIPGCYQIEQFTLGLGKKFVYRRTL
jgi:hypothetical protein